MFFITSEKNAVVIMMAALFGLVMGVFLNAIVYRVSALFQDYVNGEKKDKDSPFLSFSHFFNDVTPFSTCIHCHQRVTVWSSLFVMRYWFLRRRWCTCKATLRLRIPVIELVSGVLSALLIWRFGLSWYGLSALICLYFLIALAFIDFDTQFLPDKLTYPFLGCGLLVNLRGTIVPFENAVMGAVGGYLVLWMVCFLYKWKTGQEGMGYGDIKLVTALGAWFGGSVLLMLVGLAAIMGLLFSIVLIAFSFQERGKSFPFGPYLTIASVMMLFYNEQIIQIELDFLQSGLW